MSKLIRTPLQVPMASQGRPTRTPATGPRGRTVYNRLMKTVGARRADGNPLDDQGRLARTARALRPAGLAPRGVYRFASFEEAGTWLLQMMRRPPAPRSRKTSPASAGR